MISLAGRDILLVLDDDHAHTGPGGQALAPVVQPAEGLHHLDEADGLAMLEQGADLDERWFAGAGAGVPAPGGRGAKHHRVSASAAAVADGGALDGAGGDGLGVEEDEQVAMADGSPALGLVVGAEDQAGGLGRGEQVVEDAEDLDFLEARDLLFAVGQADEARAQGRGVEAAVELRGDDGHQRIPPVSTARSCRVQMRGFLTRR